MDDLRGGNAISVAGSFSIPEDGKKILGWRHLMFPADTNTLHDTLSLLETETKSESEFSRDVTAGVEMCDETAGVDACDKNASEDELGRFGGDLVAAKRVCQSSK